MTDGLSAGHGDDPPPGDRACAVGGVPETVRLLALALSGHVRRLRQEGLSVPREVEELTAFLVRLAMMRQDPSTPAKEHALAHHVHVPERLLVTKGEAAERLGVSIRTIERLAATGRLRQVHVERLARFRVSDLEAYVDSLGEGDAPDADAGKHDDPP
jgi:excisionase family DNA binding protein